MKISDHAFADIGQAFADMVHEDLWLVMLKQERVDTTMWSECDLCVGLLGAALFPGMTGTVSQETAREAIDEHRHYKTTDVEVLRLPAHHELDNDRVRIVPEVDQMFTASTSGTYRLAVHNADDVMLFWVDIGPMTTGSTLSSMAVSVEVPA